MKTLSIVAMLICASSLLICSFMSNQAGAVLQQEPVQASAETVTSHSVNITGEVVDSESYRILSDFVAVAVNNANGKRVLSDPFNRGDFQITLYVPGFADDNQTIDIQILSLDQKTTYGNKSLVLSDLNDTSAYDVKITVANPPPNYNWLILIVAVLMFSLILAGYIYFTKWLVGQAVLKRADEILIERRMGDVNLDENVSSGSDEGDEEDEEEKEEKSG